MPHSRGEPRNTPHLHLALRATSKVLAEGTSTPKQLCGPLQISTGLGSPRHKLPPRLFLHWLGGFSKWLNLTLSQFPLVM